MKAGPRIPCALLFAASLGAAAGPAFVQPMPEKAAQNLSTTGTL